MVSKGLLDWPDCVNARDLGGLPLAAGGATRHGALVRSDSADRLDATGWDALLAHGVRTVIDLRNDDERASIDGRPAAVETLVLAHDGLDEHPDFWATWWDDPRFATPRYFAPHLDRFPHRSARVLQAIAHARPGGVLVHCQGGRDRTGLISMLALAVVGVTPEAIAADYARSFEGTARQPTDAKVLAALDGATPQAAVLDVLKTTNIDDALARGGFTARDAAALRARLTSPGSA
ncbi:MAG TPA: tyrosine-protein phosphatase [Baekduia sp.]|uniref:tyrosine-protein phosphatase n=1 Tax=Baekduia sp. TaxID=2600305 RepID=UPI002D7807F9|nr:tyrosine-protein phosphatase [Baekduia sp.]HET6505165.1 tyrosine-protein phosphatase [Baekduia sp.]